MEDVGVVLDEVGSSRTAVFATKEYGFVACMFAATYPERTACVILHEAAANWMRSEETPWEWMADRYVEQEEWIRSSWGRPRRRRRPGARNRDPSLADDPEYVRWWARYWLLSRSPGNTVMSARKYMDTDIRGILPLIHAPVLVLARPESHPDDRSFYEESRFLASRIPGARMEELPGPDASLWVGDQAAVHREIDAFMADVGREQAEMDRVLATILFTDIAGSTERAAELGDAAWKELVERHHVVVRTLLARYRGNEVDTAGDGFFAAFDGPARAIRCALGIREAVRPLGLEIRAGLHTGEVETINGKSGRHRRRDRRARGRPCRSIRGARLADREGPGGRLGSHLRGRRRARAQGRPRPLAPVSGG